MCSINTEGYKLKTGTLLPFHNADLSRLTKEEMIELYDTPMNAYEGINIRTNLHSIREEMQKQSLMIEKALSETALHTTKCPINKSKVEEIVDNRVKTSPEISDYLEIKWVEIFQDKIITIGNLSKAIAAIIVLFGVIFAVKGLVI